MKYNIPSLLINRHGYIFSDHLTVKKTANITNLLANYLGIGSELSFFPIYAKIETTNKCNLACSHCRSRQKRKKGQFLDFELYKNTIDELKEYLLEISLYDEGEPLVDQRIFEFIRYAHARDIGTVISTNFSMELPRKDIDALVLSGLDYIQIAIDGTTQATYEKYRRNGNLDLVLENFRNLITARRKMNSSKPVVEWQMIDLDFNRHEQKDARRMAFELGADRFNIKEDTYGTYPPGKYRRHKKCVLPWSSFAIACDGSISACFIKDDDTLKMGDLHEHAIREIWHARKFMEIRSAHRFRSGMGYYCLHCNRLDGKYGDAAASKENYDRYWKK